MNLGGLQIWGKRRVTVQNEAHFEPKFGVLSFPEKAFNPEWNQKTLSEPKLEGGVVIVVPLHHFTFLRRSDFLRSTTFRRIWSRRSRRHTAPQK